MCDGNAMRQEIVTLDEGDVVLTFPANSFALPYLSREPKL
jgi:hypothetical protein